MPRLQTEKGEIVERESQARSDPERGGCVQSLVRALGLLDQLASHGGGLTLTEVAQRVQLPRSTAHRLLTTMETMRYVAFDRTTSCWLVGARALVFGLSSSEAPDASRLAQPILHTLQLDTRLTASLDAVDAGGVRCVAQSRAPGDRSTLRPGDRSGWRTSASGVAILAFWPQDKVRAWFEHTAQASAGAAGSDGLASLLVELDEVRRRGFAVRDDEAGEGLRSVAAPILGRNGEATSAVVLSGRSRRIPDAKLAWLGATLRIMARRMVEADFDAQIPNADRARPLAQIAWRGEGRLSRAATA